MLRTGSLLALCAACGALVLSVWTAVHSEGAAVFSRDGQGETTAVALARTASVAARPLDFAPVFGEVAEPVAATQVASVAPPPRLDIDLSGVLVAGQTRWAVLDAAGDSHVLREGESFGAGYRVARIMADRVEIDTGHGTVEVALGAARDRAAPVVARAEPLNGAAPAPSTEPYRAMVKSVVMTRDDVETLVALAMTR